MRCMVSPAGLISSSFITVRSSLIVFVGILAIFDPLIEGPEDGPLKYVFPLFLLEEEGILINEVLPFPGSDHNGDGRSDQDDEYIELINAGENAVNVTGWTLRDNSGSYNMQHGIMLPGVRVLLWRTETGLRLGDVDYVELQNKSGSRMDILEWSDTEKEHSFQRSPDGSQRIRRSNLVTPGWENIGLPEIVINEIMVDPPGSNSGGQWVELFNPGPLDNLDFFSLDNGDGFRIELPDIDLPRGSRCVISTGGSDGSIGSCPLIVAQTHRTMYVNGDNLQLIDPEGYVVDHVAWGNSSHVDPPPSPDPGIHWDGNHFDHDSGVMTTCYKENPNIRVGISLKRWSDGFDTGSVHDWIDDRSSMGDTKGFNNSLDPSIQFYGIPDFRFCHEKEVEKIEIGVLNMGNMSGRVDIGMMKENSNWSIEMDNNGSLLMEEGSDLTITLSCSPPVKIYGERTCLVVLSLKWQKLPFLSSDFKLELIVPGTDIGIGEFTIDPWTGPPSTIPQGTIQTIKAVVYGGGELHPGNSTISAELTEMSTNTSMQVHHEELKDLRTTSRRKIEFQIDTFGLFGTHGLTLTVDPNDELEEIDESNNRIKIDLNISPTSIPQGQEGLKLCRILWNCSTSSKFIEIMNPCLDRIDIGGLIVSDGVSYAIFPSEAFILSGERINVIWGEEGRSRSDQSLRTYSIGGDGRSSERLKVPDRIPDPQRTGEVKILSPYRHEIDSCTILSGTTSQKECTWGTIMERRFAGPGVPLDMNSSDDWNIPTSEAWIAGILPAPTGAGSGELVIVRTNGGHEDVSGLTVLLGKRCLTIPNGTFTDNNGSLVIGSDNERFKLVQGRNLDLLFGYDDNSPGILVPGGRVPGYSQLLLPNEGGMLRLADPGNTVIDEVDWGLSGSRDIHFADRDVLYWKDDPHSNWRILSKASQRVFTISGDGDRINCELNLFRNEAELIGWVMERGDMELVTDLLSGIDTFSLLLSHIASGNELTIDYGTAPWVGLDARWEMVSDVSVRSSMAKELHGSGAGISYIEEDDRIIGMSLALAGNRFAMFPGPLMDTDTNSFPYIGLEFQDPEITHDLYLEIKGTVRSGSFTDAGSHLDLIEIGPPTGTSDGLKHATIPYFKEDIVLMLEDTLGGQDPSEDHLTLFQGNTPLDLMVIKELVMKGMKADIMLNPRFLSVHGQGSRPLMEEVENRMMIDQHIHWKDGLENDVFLRSHMLRVVSEDEGIDLGLSIPGPDSSYSVSGSIRSTGNTTSVIIPSLDGSSMGLSILLEHQFSWDPIMSMDRSPFPSGLLPGRNSSPVQMDRHDIRLEEVYHDTYLPDDPDEYVAVLNTGDDKMDLSGYYLTDDEGLDIISDGLAMISDLIIGPGDLVFLARGNDEFEAQNGFTPDASLSARAGICCLNGDLRLSNSNDSVCLRDPSGAVVDAVTYGSAYLGHDIWGHFGPGIWEGPPADNSGWGRILHRRPGSYGSPGIDTDSASDWSGLRERYPGQSRIGLPGQRAMEELKFGVCPDSGSHLVDELISGSAESLMVNVYELTSPWIVSRIIGASARGVKISLLLEGNPVGGISSSEKIAVKRLVNAGIDVRFMITDPAQGIRDRYRYDHAKYIISDMERVLISTDNFKDSSFPPPDFLHGSTTRGWVVSALSEELARDMFEIFMNDINGPDIMEGATLLEEWGEVEEMIYPIMPGRFGGNFPSGGPIEEARGRVMVSPDHVALTKNPLIDRLAEARSTIDLELLDIDPYFSNGPSYGPFDRFEVDNPYLMALLDAAERGVRIRILLDGTDFDGNGIPDNSWKAELLEDIVRDEGLDDIFSIQLNPQSRTHSMGNIELVHTKGAVIDGRYTWISSFNWNRVSANDNREMGILIESRDCAGFFQEVFQFDWNGTLQDDLDAVILWAFNERTEEGDWTISLEMEVENLNLDNHSFSFYLETPERSERVLIDRTAGKSSVKYRMNMGGVTDIDPAVSIAVVSAIEGDRELDFLQFRMVDPDISEHSESHGPIYHPYFPILLILLISILVVLSLDLIGITRSKLKTAHQEE